MLYILLISVGIVVTRKKDLTVNDDSFCLNDMQVEQSYCYQLVGFLGLYNVMDIVLIDHFITINQSTLEYKLCQDAFLTGSSVKCLSIFVRSTFIVCWLHFFIIKSLFWCFFGLLFLNFITGNYFFDNDNLCHIIIIIIVTSLFLLSFSDIVLKLRNGIRRFCS